MVCLLIFMGLTISFADKPPESAYSTKPAIAESRDNFFAEPIDRIGSDLQGPYVDNVDRVECRVDALGIFYLSTSQGTGKPGLTRKLFIDFKKPVTEAEDPENYGKDTPFLSGYFSGYVQNYDKSINLWAMQIDEIKATNFRVIIYGEGWTVRFNPEEREGTTRIRVTRISEDSWVFDTLKDDALGTGDIGKLYQIVTVNKQKVWIDHGNFHLPFMVTVKLKK